ncbi:periodic tryptophan protein 2 homolog [Antedon mediterranea]|uniref:periodic tryptophan protein 2 homolog n=1 Tax=Antedon mediterranea TaxID=105859 RepID=UPI003AF8F3ED
MKFSFQFSNLLGVVYRCGNLNFSVDGNSIFSPVGNKITKFDLKNNASHTLPIETNKNINYVAISPNGNTAILVDEDGAAVLCSLISRTILHHFHFHKKVECIKFSPDGRKFVVLKENIAQVYHSPGNKINFNPFVLHRVYHGAYDDTSCACWSDDSSVFAVGSLDMSTRIYAAEPMERLSMFAVGGHKDAIVGVFFEKNSLDIYTCSRDGAVVSWECSADLEDIKTAQLDPSDKIRYSKTARHFLNEPSDMRQLTAVDYHKETRILVSGFANGVFQIHEMPDFNPIQSLSIGERAISTISVNISGDWIGLGCHNGGELVVWEWQSESFIMKQQGHYNNMTSVAYSPDGQYLATGGEDAKVKVWSMCGYCFVTFSEHTAGVTDVEFSKRGQVVVSASLDGTVRAFDLHRYRNFKTFTSPRPTQFSSLALDVSGDIVCASAQDTFEVFVWSMQNGRLLEVLSGHEGPIASIHFSPVAALLATASWDNTVKLWDVFENKGSRETLHLSTDALCVAFRPDGKELAVGTLDSQITFWDVENATQTGSVEGKFDVGAGRSASQLVTAKKTASSKSFTSLCYSADGRCILAAGKSKNVCIYSIAEQMLVKKFEISTNMSLDGMQEMLNRHKMTEFGAMALIDTTDNDNQSITLPGVIKGDMSSRFYIPEAKVSCVRFSPTGQQWAATTTEGLLVYSLNSSLTFDPFELSVNVTPDAVMHELKEGQWSSALMLSFRLNEANLIQRVVESIPVSQVSVVCQGLANVYVRKLLAFVAKQLENSHHVEFYLDWCQALLLEHGPSIKVESSSVMALLRTLQKSLTTRRDELSKLCDSNTYTLQYIICQAKMQKEEDTTEET